MLMKNKNIVLRYLTEDDIADYIRWTTIETECCDWDAPWEEDDGDKFVKRQKAALQKAPQIFRKLEIDTLLGQHIGWVTSYYIDGDEEKIAVGINIPSVDERGKGVGESSLTLFMTYLFRTKNILYTQTWSGNIAMIRLAEKIRFVEVERIKNIREVKGKTYDALTFSISKEAFFNKYAHLYTASAFMIE